MMIVTNDAGCSDTATTVIDVNLTPVAQAAPMDTSGCVPHTLSYSSNSIFVDSLVWLFGDGSISNSISGQQVYTQPGTYQPVLIAMTNDGCYDTLQLSSITAHAIPQAGFTVNQNNGCPGTQFSFTNQSVPQSGLTYQWNVAGVQSTLANPVLTLQSPGYHDVTLVVFSAAGCSDTLVSPLAVQVFDTVPPPASPITRVTVNDNTTVQIDWLNNAALDLSAYVLYRYNQATAVFQEIYRDTTPNNSSMNVISTYIDNGLNTLSKVYTYRLQTLDQCAMTLPLSALTTHTTMNVSAQPVGNNIRVSWTRYLGCPVDSYEVSRVELASGLSGIIATVPGSVLTYDDQGFQCPDDYSYRIRAISLCGSAYFSLSDTAIATPVNMLANQEVTLVRTTVVDDRDILTEWLPPAIAPSRVVQYDIMRSEDNIHFTLLASVPATTMSFIDHGAYVHEDSYFYRIEVINDCNIAGNVSNNGANILLKSGWVDEQAKLWWTPYSEWDTGVDYYIIEKQESSGQWRQIKTVDGNSHNTSVDE